METIFFCCLFFVGFLEILFPIRRHITFMTVFLLEYKFQRRPTFFLVEIENCMEFNAIFLRYGEMLSLNFLFIFY